MSRKPRACTPTERLNLRQRIPGTGQNRRKASETGERLGGCSVGVGRGESREGWQTEEQEAGEDAKQED